MAVIYRDEAPPRPGQMRGLVPLDEQGGGRGAAAELSRPALVLLAVLSTAAGVIHISMVPSHAGEWMAEAVAFAVVGWFQIGVAVVLLTRPSRAVLTITAIANVAFVAAWAVSRMWGLPFGPESGVAESASFVDIACAVFEGLLVVGAVALILPRWPRLPFVERGQGAVVGPPARGRCDRDDGDHFVERHRPFAQWRRR